jgi:hypothetical protein
LEENKMPRTPISITLYDGNDEEIETYERSRIPWGILKKALKFKGINVKNADEAFIDDLANFVVEAFGNRFTLEDLDKGADITDMFTVLQALVSRASTYLNDPN